MSSMSENTKRLLDLEGAASEEAESMIDPHDDSLPAGTTITRGHGRSRTLQIRLNGDEYEVLERLAKGRDLPVSTLARSLILTAVAPASDADSLVARIENDLAALRRVVDKH